MGAGCRPSPALKRTVMIWGNRASSRMYQQELEGAGKLPLPLEQSNSNGAALFCKRV